jgi:hypothetical protein
MVNDIVSWARTTGESAMSSAFRTIGEAVKGAFEWAKDQVETVINNLISWIETQISNAVSNLTETFNSAVPDEVNIPEVTVGGGSVDLPEAEVMGETVGGGSLNIPSETVGGGDIDLPQLAEGGIIDSPTTAVLGEGGDEEAVIPLNDRGRQFFRDAVGDGGGEGTTINIENVHATSYAEGQRAARGFKRELRSANFD